MIATARLRTICFWGCVLLLGACASDDDSDMPPDYNIRVSAIESASASTSFEFLTWGYLDSDGNLTNRVEVFCGSGSVDETFSCESLDIGFEATGEILINVVKDLGESGTCFIYTEGTFAVLADPTVQQDVVVLLDMPGGVCP